MAHKISSLIAGSLALQLACGTESWEYTEGPMAPGWDDPFAANVLAGESREDNAEQSAGSDRSRRAIERSLSHLRRNVDPRFANDDYSVEVDVVTLHEDGAESVRFRTRFLGYRVLGGDVVVHSDERGALRNIERSLQQGIFLDTSELLSESDALQLALEKLRGTLEETPEPELIIYALGHEVGPAYEVRLRAVLEDATPSLLHVYIDAVTGEHLTSWDAIIVEPITSPEQVVTAEALLDAASADDLLVLGTSSIPLDQTFRLQSKPGASKTIYLDFDGHTTTGTVWNTSTMGSSFYSPAYDTDGNASVFGDAELNRIQLIWQRLVSDFAPFDVNVTTMAPPVDWLVNKSGTDADSNWGVRVVVTSYGPSSATAGGISALGSFTYAQDCPVFVYTKSAVVTADTVSHEVGHSLGLTHDGTTSGSTYYLGHGIGETGWSPLMGGSNGNLSTWDDGTYAGSNNTGGSGNAGRGADDLAVITGYNGFGYRADQAGNSLASAAQLSISAGLVAQFGTIETRLDTDWFSFQLTAAGDLDLTFDPYWFRAYVDDDGLWGGSSTAYVGLAGDPVSTTPYQEGAANMDLAVDLYDGQGRLLASADDTGLGARLAAQGLSAGSYYLKLDGVGLGDPTASPPTGYSDYASIGNYWISGTITAASDPTPLPAISLSLAATAVLENGTEGLVYTFARSGLANEALSVNFTWSGTATNGVDYTGLSTQNIQTITFPAASSTAALVLQPQPDNTVEGDETVGLTILSAPTYSVSTAETVVGVILDDDSVPVVPTFTPFVDVLSGTPESDAFVLLSWSDALLGATPDRITNLQTASDFIDTPATRTTAAKVKQLGSVASLSVNNIGALLTNKNFPRNNVATFTCPGSTGTRTFAAINDGNAGFQASTDPVIEITGYSGALSGLKVY